MANDLITRGRTGRVTGDRGDRPPVPQRWCRRPVLATAGRPFSGAIVAWSYPEHLHGRALTRVAVVRHAISVLLDDLEDSTTVEVQ
jgi:hypothetical protein